MRGLTSLRILPKKYLLRCGEVQRRDRIASQSKSKDQLGGRLRKPSKPFCKSQNHFRIVDIGWRSVGVETRDLIVCRQQDVVLNMLSMPVVRRSNNSVSNVVPAARCHDRFIG